MRIFLLAGFVLMTLRCSAADPNAGNLWTELKAKRDSLSSSHQEFNISRTSKTASESQSSKSRSVLDMSRGRWREVSISGSGNRIRIFDGEDLFSLEEGGDEFVRVKLRAKDPAPVPNAYLPAEADWAKAQELQRRPCGLSGQDHTCAVLEVRLKPWSRGGTQMLQGVAQISIDTATGLVLQLRTIQTIEGSRSSYQSEVNYNATQLNYGTPEDAALFKLPPAALREVKELSRWNAAKIKKQLAGKAAPEFTGTDIHGSAVNSADYKGKTVLLDFWTTWCPPCRADAPALDKLFQKYGGQELMIVGISVSEDRQIVEKFLKEHPHSFPVVLTTENEMPIAYQIGEFPTYIVIDKDGSVASAAEGDQGFSDLRKMLKKAGLEVE